MSVCGIQHKQSSNILPVGEEILFVEQTDYAL